MDINGYSNSELEEMGLDPQEIEEEAQAAMEEATACMCSDPLCPCVKRWQIA